MPTPSIERDIIASARTLLHNPKLAHKHLLAWRWGEYLPTDPTETVIRIAPLGIWATFPTNEDRRPRTPSPRP